MDDLAIRSLVARLSRPHPSGGAVIERAAILAEGGDSAEIVGWIAEHDGRPEAAAPARHAGLHGDRVTDDAHPHRAPLRYVLPAGALD